MKYLTGKHEGELYFEGEDDEIKDETLIMKFRTTNNGTRGHADFYLRNNRTGKRSHSDTFPLSHGFSGFNDFKKMMELDKSGTIKRAWDNFKQNIGIEIEIPHENFVILKQSGLLKLGFGKSKSMD